jgi:RsiW-degrading membrane proteinase PrsW (M82 family)
LGSAFLPPIIYAIWIRNTERFNRARWSAITVCFLWGASIAIIAAVLLEITLDVSVNFLFIEGTPTQIIAAIMIAPFAEELIKPLALRSRFVKKNIEELEDGLILGAVAGLGFSATENLLYGMSFFSEGLMPFLILMSIRSIGGCLLHASATALTGYGYGKTLLHHTTLIKVLPYFIAAMLMHGLYNFLVSWERIGTLIGLLSALVLVYVSVRFIRGKIKALDASN